MGIADIVGKGKRSRARYRETLAQPLPSVKPVKPPQKTSTLPQTTE
ncbi:MAG: hypothetical protein SW833_14390 [Cyanobacteriota bacterium]|nr:hypothetical protein [Cyanobacteriota bacterium]